MKTYIAHDGATLVELEDGEVVTDTTGAEPSNRVIGHDTDKVEWVEYGRVGDSAVRLVYFLTAEESAMEDMSNVDWSPTRIELVQ